MNKKQILIVALIALGIILVVAFIIYGNPVGTIPDTCNVSEENISEPYYYIGSMRTENASEPGVDTSKVSYYHDLICIGGGTTILKYKV